MRAGLSWVGWWREYESEEKKNLKPLRFLPLANSVLETSMQAAACTEAGLTLAGLVNFSRTGIHTWPSMCSFRLAHQAGRISVPQKTEGLKGLSDSSSLA